MQAGGAHSIQQVHHALVRAHRPLDYSAIPSYFYYMESSRLIRTVLCIYECMRFAFLVGIFMLLQPNGAAAFPWLALITPGALFLFMALFWRINITYYRPYGPLYLAGKSLSIIATMFWLFFIKGFMIRELLNHDAALFIISGIVFFLILGDILSAWLVNIIMKQTSERRQ